MSYSFVEILFPWKMPIMEDGRQPLHIKVEGKSISPRNKTKEIALKFVNRFIDVVRYVTGSYHLEHLSYPDLIFYKQFSGLLLWWLKIQLLNIRLQIINQLKKMIHYLDKNSQ